MWSCCFACGFLSNKIFRCIVPLSNFYWEVLIQIRCTLLRLVWSIKFNLYSEQITLKVWFVGTVSFDCSRLIYLRLTLHWSTPGYSYLWISAPVGWATCLLWWHWTELYNLQAGGGCSYPMSIQFSFPFLLIPIVCGKFVVIPISTKSLAMWPKSPSNVVLSIRITNTLSKIH